MLENTIREGKDPRTIYSIPQTDIEDATAYIKVPLGYSPNIDITGVGTATVSVTLVEASDPSTITWWTDKTPESYPADLSSLGQVTFLKVVATGAITLKGFCR